MRKVRRLVRHRYRHIVSLAIFIATLTALTVGGAIFELRDDAMDEATRGVSGLASMLAEQVQQSNQAMDITLNELKGALSVDTREEFERRARSPALASLLASVADKRETIDLVTLLDAGGVPLANSRGLSATLASASGGAFAALAADPEAPTQVGGLYVSDVSGAMVVDLVQPVRSAAGRLLGAIRIAVKPGELVTTYSPISTLPGRSYALFTRDGVVLARYPDASFMRAGDRLPAASGWYATVARGGGVYNAYSHFDEQKRLIAVRPVRFTPFVVSVSMLERTALAHWRMQAIAIGFFALTTLVVAAALMRALQAQFRKLAEKEGVLRAQANALELSNERFAKALGNMSQGLVVFDANGRVVICNDRYATLYGIDPAAIRPGVRARDILKLRAEKGLFAGRDPASYLRDAMSRQYSDQRIDRLTDGRAILVSHATCADGGMVVTHEDVTERERVNQRVAHLAMHDELTQLANRALFLQTIESLERQIGAAYAAVVVMLVDLDDFKPVNDTHGHAAGDAVLRECAARLKAAAPAAHVAARLGGDEFAIAYGAEDADPRAALALARDLARAISRPYALSGLSIEIAACVGVAIVDDPDLSIDAMMRRADLALYAAKAEGAGLCRLFEPAMESDAITRRQLAADLADAIRDDGLELAYQPIVDAETAEVRQMEALVRWRHPARGLIPPMEFIPLAEETRQIEALGRWVLRRACADAACWPAQVGVAVNVSSLQIVARDFANLVLSALASADLAPGRLELEITESVLLQDRGDSLSTLQRLRDEGVSIALDDFGTGFSSMSYLKRFAFDKLKIDRSFVADSPRDGGSAAIVAATVQLARAFDIEVTAEGVETVEQREALRAAGVRLMQGYLFGRPGPAEAALRAAPAGAGPEARRTA